MFIRLLGFDADDILWCSQDYFDEAQLEFERIIRRYVCPASARRSGVRPARRAEGDDLDPTGRA